MTADEFPTTTTKADDDEEADDHTCSYTVRTSI